MARLFFIWPVSFLLYILSFAVPRKQNRYAFGSWFGTNYIDNSRYLYEYILSHDPKAELIWIGDKSIKTRLSGNPRTRVYSRDSIRAVWALLRSRYMFCSQLCDVDLCKFYVYRGAVVTYLHHGVPVKRWGDDAVRVSSKRKRFRGLRRLSRRLNVEPFQYDYFIATSPLNRENNLTALKSRGCTPEKIIDSGYPRNDMLVNFDPAKARHLKEVFCEEYRIDSQKRIVLYLPTFRRKGTPTRSFVPESLSKEDYETLRRVLTETDAVLVEKCHIAEDLAPNTEKGFFESGNVLHLTNDRKVNVQELLLFADVLISDYSGAFLDFVLLDRPIIHYAYDYEEYRDFDSGLYYPIEEFAAGDIVRTHRELCVSLRENLTGIKDDRIKRARVRQTYMSYEQGTASETIWKTVIGSH